MTRANLLRRQLKWLQRVNDGIFMLSQDDKNLRTKWMSLMKTPEYRNAKLHEKPLMALALVRNEIGDRKDLREMIEYALLMNPVFLNRELLFDTKEDASAWFCSSQPGLKGDIPWVIMQTENGARRVRGLLKKSMGPDKVSPWVVDSFQLLDGFRIFVRFTDGTTGIIDLENDILDESAGVFEKIRDPAVFRKVAVVQGALTWPVGIDLAPDAMYDDLKKSSGL